MGTKKKQKQKKKNGFMSSKEMSFENVDDNGQMDDDDGWTTGACLYYKLTYEPSPQVS